MRLLLLLLAGLLSASSARAQVLNISGAGIDTNKIAWVWNNVGGANSYLVQYSSAAQAAGCVTTTSFIQSLTPNTSASIRVETCSDGVCGACNAGTLASSTTHYTWAAQPVAAVPPLDNRSSFGFTGHWTISGNTAGTKYDVLVLKSDGSTASSGSSSDDTFTYDFNNGNGAVPNTTFTMEVAAENAEGVVSTYTVLGTTLTLAAAPASLSVTANTPSSLSIAWDAAGNPATTPYEVQLTTSGGSWFPITFAQRFTAQSATVSGLNTGVQYTIQVYAEDAAGEITGSSLPQVVTTTNGGAPANNFEGVATPAQGLDLVGTFQNGATGRIHRLEVNVPPGAFDQQVTVLVSSQPPVAACGPIDADFSITTIPPAEPKLPVSLSFTLGLSPPQTGVVNAGQISLVRYDAASKTCVPLGSVPQSISNTVIATTNHLTEFVVQQISPQTSLVSRRVFPNPLHVSSQGYMTFDHLPAETRVRIFTLQGEEVFDDQANDSGVLVWKATNKSGQPVGSGIYLAVLGSGKDRATVKLVVIR